MLTGLHHATAEVGRTRLELAKAEPAVLQTAPFAAQDTDPQLPTSDLNREPTAYQTGAPPD